MGPLKVTEVFCYICRGILIEPVTLPCFHVFCFTCFEQSMQETSYSCPLCRKRISNWVRSVKKGSNLINQKLWKQIQEEYGDQVNLKLNGEDDGLDQQMQREYPVLTLTSKPGEVAEEFSKLLNDLRLERERLNEAEELASKELIVKLAEEEERQIKLLREKNNMIYKEDSLLAKKIQEEIDKEVASTPSSSFKTSSATPPNCSKKSDKKGKKLVQKAPKGPMDEFLKCHLDINNKKELNLPSDDRSTSADSTDSISMETNLFKPIKRVLTTPPKRYSDGRIREISLTRVTPLKLNFDNLPPTFNNSNVDKNKKIHSLHSAFVDTNSSNTTMDDEYESPTKRLKFSSEEQDSGVLKDITFEENNDSNSSTIAQNDPTKKKSKQNQESFDMSSIISKYALDIEENDNENDKFETQDYLNPDVSIEKKLIEEQKRIEQILLQEQEDRKLALRLSREWELEVSKKPLTRSMQKNNKNSNCGKRKQKTLVEAMSSRTKNRQK